MRPSSLSSNKNHSTSRYSTSSYVSSTNLSVPSLNLRSSLSSPSSSTYATRTHLPYVSSSILVAHCVGGSSSMTSSKASRPSSSMYSSNSLLLPSSSHHHRQNDYLSPKSSYLSISNKSTRLPPQIPSSTSLSYNFSSSSTSSRYHHPSTSSGLHVSSTTVSSYPRTRPRSPLSSFYRPIKLRERPLLSSISHQLNSYKLAISSTNHYITPRNSFKSTNNKVVTGLLSSSDNDKNQDNTSLINNNSNSNNRISIIEQLNEESTNSLALPPNGSEDNSRDDNDDTWSSDLSRNISRNKYLIKFREVEKPPRKSLPSQLEPFLDAVSLQTNKSNTTSQVNDVNKKHDASKQTNVLEQNDKQQDNIDANDTTDSLVKVDNNKPNKHNNDDTNVSVNEPKIDTNKEQVAACFVDVSLNNIDKSDAIASKHTLNEHLELQTVLLSDQTPKESCADTGNVIKRPKVKKVKQQVSDRALVVGKPMKVVKQQKYVEQFETKTNLKSTTTNDNKLIAKDKSVFLLSSSPTSISATTNNADTLHQQQQQQQQPQIDANKDDTNIEQLPNVALKSLDLKNETNCNKLVVEAENVISVDLSDATKDKHLLESKQTTNQAKPKHKEPKPSEMKLKLDSLGSSFSTDSYIESPNLESKLARCKELSIDTDETATAKQAMPKLKKKKLKPKVLNDTNSTNELTSKSVMTTTTANKVANKVKSLVGIGKKKSKAEVNMRDAESSSLNTKENQQITSVDLSKAARDHVLNNQEQLRAISSEEEIHKDKALLRVGNRDIEGACLGLSSNSGSSSRENRIKFREYSMDDFNIVSVLGHGGWGFVFLAELKQHALYFAVKAIKKQTIAEDDDYDSIIIERKMLTMGNVHAFICKLFCTFESEAYLFFVMEFCAGGDLMFHVQREGKFSESRCRFYAAEIICAIRFLHNQGIVYRDLKLDNILLSAAGHIRLVDFGMCQCKMYREEMLPSNFCGTPEYIAPEIIKGVPYNHSVDWWSFGVLLYEMAIGKMPFRGGDENELLWNVCYEQIHYPLFLTKDLTCLLKGLLEREPTLRMGMATCKQGDICDHVWFRGVDWRKVEQMKLEPPFVPRVLAPNDVQNFDRDFTDAPAELSPIDESALKKIDQNQFKGFTYTNPEIFANFGH